MVWRLQETGPGLPTPALPERNLWVSKSDGSEARQMTFAPMKSHAPRWSPDGKQIVFIGTEPAKTDQIYIIPAEGGNPEQCSKEQKQNRTLHGHRAAMRSRWAPPSATAGSSTQHPIQILNLKSHELTALPEIQVDTGRRAGLPMDAGSLPSILKPVRWSFLTSAHESGKN